MKNKTVLFAIEGTVNQNSAWKSALYRALEKIFGKIILFDPAKETLKSGIEQTANDFFNTIKMQKPDFLMFVPAMDSTGFFTLEIIRKINKTAPKIKTIALLGDDDVYFECGSRYVMLFIDYALIVQCNYAKEYEKEGLRQKIFLTNISNNELFKSLDLEKIYDVVFIGRPTKERTNSLRFLIKNGINLKIFGQNWSDYPEFKQFYNGAISNEELVRVINQSKINLSFSRNDFGELHYKGRVFEVAESKAFQLVEYFSGYLDFFKNKKEIVFFKNDAELLEKTKYYLKNGVEREQIAKSAYVNVTKNYNLNIKLKEFFKRVDKDDKNFKRECVSFKKNVVVLQKKILGCAICEIKEKISGADHILFYDEKDEIFEYRALVQLRAFEKTKKPMSCCGYYVFSKSLGDYLLVRSNLNYLSESEFNGVVDLTQIMVARDYFLENIDLFQQFYRGNKINLVNKTNTAFVDLPLYRSKTIKKRAGYQILERLFKGGCLFLVPLYSSLRNGRIFFNLYPYKVLFVPILNGNTFILKHLIASLFNKKYWNRLVGNEKNYAETVSR